MTWEFIVGLVIGLYIGRLVGEWSEHKLWLDAVAGREKIMDRCRDRRKDEHD